MKLERHTRPWEYYTFSNIFNSDIVEMLNTIPLTKYYNEHTHQDELDHNYDQKNVLYHDVVNSDVARIFTDADTVRHIQNLFDVDLRLKGVRLTLAEIVGVRDEWVHVDSEDKLISAVVYLGNEVLPEKGTWMYESQNELYVQLDHIPNAGILFKPTRETWHSLPKWESEVQTRKALIVNYINIPTPLQLIADRTLRIPDNVFRTSI